VPWISSVPIRTLLVLTLNPNGVSQRDRSAGLPDIRMLLGRKLPKS
jgi:hypothetical protein